ncbi:hypothetical protein F5Y04DRAFT_261342 [Hypomontagnella monticulosa]|nr:hypothetical protein F5Y04DRAFT_261342 [Hypomontagnella monticulosa]
MPGRPKRYKGREPDKPVVMAANSSERKFKNVDLLKSLMSGSKKGTSGRSTLPPKHSSDLRSSVEQITESDTHDRSNIESPSATPEAPSPHPENESPNVEISEDIASIISDGFSCLSLDLSLDVPLQSSPNATLQELDTEPVPKSKPGLKALFQQPVRLRPHSASYPTIRPDDSVPTSPSVQASLTTTPSVKSDRSQTSESSTSGQSSGAESQISSVDPPFNQPPPPLPEYQSSIAFTHHRSSSSTNGNTYEANLRREKVALSQVFMYQARVSCKPTYDAESTSLTPRNAIPVELEGDEPEPNGIQGKKPKVTPTPSVATTTILSPTYGNSISPQSLDSGLIVLEPDCRRNAVDSQHWQRKTKMFR